MAVQVSIFDDKSTQHTARLCIQTHTFIGVNVRVPLKFPLLEDELEDVTSSTVKRWLFVMVLLLVKE